MLRLCAFFPASASGAAEVADALGDAFVDPPQPDLGKPYADSSPLGAIIFVLSAGSDPFLALQKFAQDRQKESARERFARALARDTLQSILHGTLSARQPGRLSPYTRKPTDYTLK